MRSIFSDHQNLFILVVMLAFLCFALPCFAEDDALAAPTAPESQPAGAKPRPTATANPVMETEPADVVGQNGETVPMTAVDPTPAPSVSPTPAATFTKTPTSTPTPKPDKNAKKTPTPNRTTTPYPTPVLHLPQVTTIPNPAYGDKVIFRVMAAGPAKVEIVVYDRFFNKVKDLKGEGDRLFDVLWNLKKVAQGLYYYQCEITDTATGGVQMLKMQSFAVMKDEANPDGD